jgi:uncharacterized membrane protein YccC
LDRVFKRFAPTWPASSPNQIALVWALRGTIAAGLPLLILPLLGLDTASRAIAVGALNTSLVDVGGSYRGRLNAMAFNAVAAPLVLLLGSQTREPWWLAAASMFFVALGSGLARSLGPSGVPLGLMFGIAFLIGTNVSSHLRVSVEFASLYALGGIWTIAVALVFWRARPFKRLEQEVAGVWEKNALFMAMIRTLQTENLSVVARRRSEQVVASSHQALREAVERARDALGTVRAEVSGPGTTTANLMILIRTASRSAAAGLALAEILDRQAQDGASPRQDALESAINDLELSCRSIAATILSGKGSFSPQPVRKRLIELTTIYGPTSPEVMAFAQAGRNIEVAAEAIQLVVGAEEPLSSVLLPIWSADSSPASAFTTIRAQISFQSAIFRHASRVAVGAALGTAAVAKFDLQHGIWLPMTTLIVLQPEFGGTLSRASQRTAGTVAGAMIAGLLLAAAHGTFAINIAVVLLLTAALFVLRRRYGLGVTFLTPLIVLLLATSVGNPWTDTIDRVLDTIAGAGVGLLAGYLLWPTWERERLPAQLARAIHANRNYMVQVFGALSGDAPPPESVGEFRRQAEIATGNADVGFQRLLAEPRVQRGRISRAFALVTYIQRLERHLIALASHIGEITLPKAELHSLLSDLEKTQTNIAKAIIEDSIPESCPSFDTDLGRLRSKIMEQRVIEPSQLLDFLLSKIVNDTTSLHSAVTMRQ